MWPLLSCGEDEEESRGTDRTADSPDILATDARSLGVLEDRKSKVAVGPHGTPGLGSGSLSPPVRTKAMRPTISATACSPLLGLSG